MKNDVSISWLQGVRCAIVGAGAATGYASVAVESALCECLRKAGAEVLLLTGLDEAFDVDADDFKGVDTLFVISQSMLFGQCNAETLWRGNVEVVKCLTLVAELAEVRRIVALGSIFSLGHSPDGSPVDVATPYLSDDARTLCEKSLFRGEMELWGMAERGLSVTVVCGGVPVGPEVEEALRFEVLALSSSALSSHLPSWLRLQDVAERPHLFSRTDVLAQALVSSSSPELVGRRLICAGLDLPSPSAANPSTIIPLPFIRRISSRAEALTLLRRAGHYVSDFPLQPDEK